MAKQKVDTEAAPAWALAIRDTVCTEHNVPIVPLVWRNGTKYHTSSGTCHSTATQNDDGTSQWVTTHIAITAGASGIDKLSVLLHELAHHIAGHTHHHDQYFYEWCFYLYARYRLPLAYCYEREASYRKVSMQAAAKYFNPPQAIRTHVIGSLYAGRSTYRQYNPAIHDDANTDPSWKLLLGTL